MNESIGNRGKYSFGLLAVGEYKVSESDWSKRSVRTFVGYLNRNSGKTFRCLSDGKGFIVLRTA